LDPLKFQAMHFTFGIDGREERWEILITVAVVLLHVENYEQIYVYKLRTHIYIYIYMNIKWITNKISNFEIHIFWNIHNTIFNMLVFDEIIRCPRVCVYLQTNTAVSRNANTKEMQIKY
jgi:hypothetical protein